LQKESAVIAVGFAPAMPPPVLERRDLDHWLQSAGAAISLWPSSSKQAISVLVT
jgi:hypothetical protein